MAEPLFKTCKENKRRLDAVICENVEFSTHSRGRYLDQRQFTCSTQHNLGSSCQYQHVAGKVGSSASPRAYSASSCASLNLDMSSLLDIKDEIGHQKNTNQQPKIGSYTHDDAVFENDRLLDHKHAQLEGRSLSMPETGILSRIGSSRRVSPIGDRLENGAVLLKSYQRSCSEPEPLEPFQVVSGFIREPPSYWLGCLYRFRPGSSKLEITLRQTGVLPDIISRYRLSKLSTSVHVPGANSQSVVMVKSKSDNSFRPQFMVFDVKDKACVLENGLTIRLYLHMKLVWRKRIAEWSIPLNRCTEETKTEWRKYRSQQ